MAVKGDKARLYDVAFRMYTADNKSLAEIEAALGVSRQTLSLWKGDTRKPGDDLDEWDRAREQKRTNAQRLRALFDRELRALEEAPAGSLTTVGMDAVTKLGSLVHRWESMEKTPSFDRPKVFLENVQFIAGWLRENDPEGLKVLAANIDALTVAFKVECLDGNA